MPEQEFFNQGIGEEDSYYEPSISANTDSRSETKRKQKELEDIKSYTLDQGLPFLEVPWKTKTMMIFLNVLKESFKKKPRSCSLALIILLLNTKNLFATVITIRKNMHMLRGRLRAYTLP